MFSLLFLCSSLITVLLDELTTTGVFSLHYCLQIFAYLLFLFQLESFDDILQNLDQRIWKALDEKYLATELNFSREKHVCRSLAKGAMHVNSKLREDQVNYVNVDSF